MPGHHEYQLRGTENRGIRIGDTVVVFAEGTIDLCATAGAKLRGASLIIAVDGIEARPEVSKRLGADVGIDFTKVGPVTEIVRLTGGRVVDVAIEALGTRQMFESCLRALKPGGTLSSLGVCSGKQFLPLDAFAAGLGDHRFVTMLWPGARNECAGR